MLILCLLMLENHASVTFSSAIKCYASFKMRLEILKISNAPSRILKFDHALVFQATSKKQITRI